MSFLTSLIQWFKREWEDAGKAADQDAELRRIRRELEIYEEEKRSQEHQQNLDNVKQQIAELKKLVIHYQREGNTELAKQALRNLDFAKAELKRLRSLRPSW